MSEVKFTPSPWVIREDVFATRSGSIDIYNSDYSIWLFTAMGNHVGPKGSAETEANAKIIMAAPDLLSALNSLVLSIKAHPDYTGEDNEEWTDLVNIANDVISKATT